MVLLECFTRHKPATSYSRNTTALLCLVFTNIFLLLQDEDTEEEPRSRRGGPRQSQEPAPRPAPLVLHSRPSYLPWWPTKLFPKLFQASVHPYLLPSMPFRSVVTLSSAWNDAECPRQAPVFPVYANRQPKSSVAEKCQRRAAVPLAGRGPATRPQVPPLPRPARKFPPTGATLTQSGARRTLADLSLAPVHLPRVTLQLPGQQALLTVREARTRAWVLSQIEVETVPAVAPSALGCEACCCCCCCEGLQLPRESVSVFIISSIIVHCTLLPCTAHQ